MTITIVHAGAARISDGLELSNRRTHAAVDVLLRELGTCTSYADNLTDEHSREFRRSIAFARLCAAVAGEDPPPRPHDAVVQFISDRRMTIGGFERDSVTGQCRA